VRGGGGIPTVVGPLKGTDLNDWTINFSITTDTYLQIIETKLSQCEITARIHNKYFDKARTDPKLR
jgi:hypothetical protein